jgi:hypothetical protein
MLLSLASFPVFLLHNWCADSVLRPDCLLQGVISLLLYGRFWGKLFEQNDPKL